MEIECWDHALSRTPASIPVELRLAVLGHVEKSELKQLRLVSKEWHAIATTPLFDKIYISPHETDLEIWDHITRHPVLRDAVKELVYDTGRFQQNLSYEDYYNKLLPRIWCTAGRRRWRPFNSSCTQLNDLIEEYKHAMEKPDIGLATINKAHKYDTYVIEGYQVYIANAAYEQWSVHSGKHGLSLHRGLQLLSQLTAVSISYDHWDRELSIPRETNLLARRSPGRGSPLSRTWNPFHLDPEPPTDLNDGDAQMCDHFATVTQALEGAHRLPKSFRCGFGDEYARLSPFALSLPTILNAATTAYAELEDFSVTIFTRLGDDLTTSRALTGISRLLSSMHQLKRLSLRHERDVEPGMALHYRYDQIFPNNTICSNLTHLTISILAIHAIDFLLLIWRQPSLRTLLASNIDLTGGTWQGIIEGLRLKHLAQFAYIDEFTLRGNHISQAPLPMGVHNRENDDYELELCASIENYIENGGHHPFLDPKDPSETAICYLYDLFPNKTANRMRAHARRTGPLNVTDLLGLISETEEP